MRAPNVRAVLCVAALLVPLSFAMHSGFARAAVQEPTPEAWEAELKKLVAERGRVVVVVSTEGIFWAFRAASVAGISNNVVRLAKGAATNMAENAGPRNAILSALRQFTETPSPAPDGSWGLLQGGQLIRGASGVTKEETSVEVRAIVTWWCERGARGCTNPPP